jgi:hypothetical protein
MGFFGSKIIECPKDQWTTLISNFAAGMPKSWEITFKSQDGTKVSGKYIEKKSLWIFPGSPIEGELQEKMTFQRDWLNTIYSIKIKPEMDVMAEID